MVQMRDKMTIGEKITDNKTKAGTSVYNQNEILTRNSALSINKIFNQNYQCEGSASNHKYITCRWITYLFESSTKAMLLCMRIKYRVFLKRFIYKVAKD